MATLANSGTVIPWDRSTTAVRHRVSVRAFAAGVMLLGSFVLLFARLGTYSLWTDEASTAITAKGVWNTGDTSAWLNDHNLLAYRDGLLLKHQKDRYTSPLQFYVAAPFVGLIGDTAFACRLPFALCGMATVGLMVWWLWQLKAPSGVWIAATIILLGNASFFLFQRQCRYYALATLLSTVVAWGYCHWNGTRRQLLGIGVAMALLLASQYLDYAAIVGCLLIDYGIWGRRRRPIRGINWLILIAPQLLMAVIVCPIWNPIARASDAVGPVVSPVTHAAITAGANSGWFGGFATMFWWNLRDLLACDFVVLPLLVICPLLYFKRKNVWLLRAPLALLVFLGTIAFFTAHPVGGEGNAEVRHSRGFDVPRARCQQRATDRRLFCDQLHQRALATGGRAIHAAGAVDQHACSTPSHGLCQPRLVRFTHDVGCAGSNLRLATERSTQAGLHRTVTDLFQRAHRARLPDRLRTLSRRDSDLALTVGSTRDQLRAGRDPPRLLEGNVPAGTHLAIFRHRHSG
jgi:hypothetical protein